MSTPNNQDDHKKVINDLEETFYMGSGEVAQFLRDLAEQIDSGNELTIKTDDWDLPFQFRTSQIELEIDRDDNELEIEFEFEEDKENESLSVN